MPTSLRRWLMVVVAIAATVLLHTATDLPWRTVLVVPVSGRAAVCPRRSAGHSGPLRTRRRDR
jgi:hypothetical protein